MIGVGICNVGLLCAGCCFWIGDRCSVVRVRGVCSMGSRCGGVSVWSVSSLPAVYLDPLRSAGR